MRTVGLLSSDGPELLDVCKETLAGYLGVGSPDGGPPSNEDGDKAGATVAATGGSSSHSGTPPDTPRPATRAWDFDALEAMDPKADSTLGSASTSTGATDGAGSGSGFDFDALDALEASSATATASAQAGAASDAEAVAPSSGREPPAGSGWGFDFEAMEADPASAVAGSGDGGAIVAGGGDAAMDREAAGGGLGFDFDAMEAVGGDEAPAGADPEEGNGLFDFDAMEASRAAPAAAAAGEDGAAPAAAPSDGLFDFDVAVAGTQLRVGGHASTEVASAAPTAEADGDRAASRPVASDGLFDFDEIEVTAAADAAAKAAAEAAAEAAAADGGLGFDFDALEVPAPAPPSPPAPAAPPAPTPPQSALSEVLPAEAQAAARPSDEPEAAPSATSEEQPAPAEAPSMLAEACEAPPTPAEAPPVPIESPPSLEAPPVPAEAPSVPAQAPSVPAEAQQVPAEAPQVPAEAPSVPSEAPQVPAEAPLPPAEAPPPPEEAAPVPAEAPPEALAQAPAQAPPEAQPEAPPQAPPQAASLEAQLLQAKDKLVKPEAKTAMMCLACRSSSEKGRLGPVGSPYTGKWYCEDCWKAWADDEQVKCKRFSCVYKRHSSQSHGFCCKFCAEGKPHGSACERKVYVRERRKTKTAEKADPVDAKAQTPAAPPAKASEPQPAEPQPPPTAPLSAAAATERSAATAEPSSAAAMQPAVAVEQPAASPEQPPAVAGAPPAWEPPSAEGAAPPSVEPAAALEPPPGSEARPEAGPEPQPVPGPAVGAPVAQPPPAEAAAAPGAEPKPAVQPASWLVAVQLAAGLPSVVAEPAAAPSAAEGVAASPAQPAPAPPAPPAPAASSAAAREAAALEEALDALESAEVAQLAAEPPAPPPPALPQAPQPEAAQPAKAPAPPQTAPAPKPEVAQPAAPPPPPPPAPAQPPAPQAPAAASAKPNAKISLKGFASDVAAGASVKCARAGCMFQRHPVLTHGHCCNFCRDGKPHGPACQRKLYEAPPKGGAKAAQPPSPASAPSAPAAAAAKAAAKAAPADASAASPSPAAADARQPAAYWGIVDVKFDPRQPEGRRVSVLELGDGQTSGFSQHGQPIRIRFDNEYYMDKNPLRCAVLVENKKVTHDRFVREGFQHLRPPAMCYPRRYSTDLARRMLTDLGLASGASPGAAVVLKLCNRSRGAGVVVVPVQKLDATLRTLLTPPTGEPLRKYLAKGLSEVLKQGFKEVFEESCLHWWSNECPFFVAEACCHSVPISPDRDGQSYDGTMRVSFVLRRKVPYSPNEETVVADPSMIYAVDWLGGYWKLPRTPLPSGGGVGKKAAEDNSLEKVLARTVSSFNSAEKLTAEVSRGHLQEVYAALTPALPRVFKVGALDRNTMMKEYSSKEPVFCAFVLARLSCSVRASRMDGAKELLQDAKKHLPAQVVPNGNDLGDLAARAANSYIERNMAVCHAMKKVWDGALLAAERSIKSLPTNSSAYYMKGVILQEREDTQEAATCMQRSVLFDPDFKLPYIALGSCQLLLQGYDEAAEASRACLRRYPDSTAAHLNRGQALYHTLFGNIGKVGFSAELCKEAIQALKISKERVPEGWQPSHEGMLQYLLSTPERRQHLPRQPVRTWSVAGWRP